jgi:hypothetical protein
MVDDILCGGLWELGIEQGAPASLGAFLSTSTTAEQAEAVMSVDFTHEEIPTCRAAKHLAFRIDTGESVEVGSLHGVLLEYSWSLAQRLHTTRRCLSTPLR